MNIALGIEYSGNSYCGWQKQSHAPSVQEELEKVLTQIANHTVKVFCAGRTDTGVHATGQVVHFELNTKRPLKAWYLGANCQLPKDISIRWAKEVPQAFHARFSALARRYRYVIQNTPYPPASLAGKVTWYKNQLNVDHMHLAAQSFLGEHDFSSFQASSCQSKTSSRFIHQMSVTRVNEFIVVDIQANAFLHHMVRNIVGCLIEIGTGKQTTNFVTEILAKLDRTQAPMTAKPDGLYLVEVSYPENYELPKMALGPLTFANQMF